MGLMNLGPSDMIVLFMLEGNICRSGPVAFCVFCFLFCGVSVGFHTSIVFIFLFISFSVDRFARKRRWRREQGAEKYLCDGARFGHFNYVQSPGRFSSGTIYSTRGKGTLPSLYFFLSRGCCPRNAFPIATAVTKCQKHERIKKKQIEPRS